MYSVEGDRKRAIRFRRSRCSAFIFLFRGFTRVQYFEPPTNQTRTGAQQKADPFATHGGVQCVLHDRSCTCDLSHSHVDRERTEDHKDADRTECV